jgi:hypothetical protein
MVKMSSSCYRRVFSSTRIFSSSTLRPISYFSMKFCSRFSAVWMRCWRTMKLCCASLASWFPYKRFFSCRTYSLVSFVFMATVQVRSYTCAFFSEILCSYSSFISLFFNVASSSCSRSWFSRRNFSLKAWSLRSFWSMTEPVFFRVSSILRRAYRKDIRNS